MKKNKFHPKGHVALPVPEGMLMTMKSGESNADALKRWQVKDVKTRWAVYDDGLKIWYNGKLIAEIHPDEFPYLLSDLAMHLRRKKCNES